ncbi:MAG TPA: hypothetical protein VIJ94_15710 [Caulobacteraceae bacterium]
MSARVFSDDEINAAVIGASGFQQQAAGADQGFMQLMKRLQELGVDPEAIAAGAVFATVRLHMVLMKPPVTVREVIKLMVPAISGATTALLEEAQDG